MYCVYVLRGKNNKIYIGYTSDLKKRLREHNSRKSYTTSKMLPVEVVYYEAYKSKEDAEKREKKLKQYGGSLGHLKKRIHFSLYK